MKIIISQGVKIIGDRFPYNWRKQYESTIIPHIGDSISDPIWKDPYEYKVIEVTIDYYSNECFVIVDNYIDEISNERKDDFSHMAELHGWESSWNFHR